MAGFVGESSPDRCGRLRASRWPRVIGWQLPAHVSFPKYDHRLETALFRGQTDSCRWLSEPVDDNSSRNEIDNGRKTASAAQLIRTFAAGARALNATARIGGRHRGQRGGNLDGAAKGSDGGDDGESRGRRGGHANAWHRTTASVDAGGRVSREIQRIVSRDRMLCRGLNAQLNREAQPGRFPRRADARQNPD